MRGEQEKYWAALEQELNDKDQQRSEDAELQDGGRRPGRCWDGGNCGR